MSIYYKVVQRTEPGQAGGGEKKYIAMATHRTKIGLRELAKDISLRTTLSIADMVAAVAALEDVIIDHLKVGHSVQLGDIGIITPQLKSETRDDPKEVNYTCIKEVKLSFRPGIPIKDELKKCKFMKVKG